MYRGLPIQRCSLKRSWFIAKSPQICLPISKGINRALSICLSVRLLLYAGLLTKEEQGKKP